MNGGSPGMVGIGGMVGINGCCVVGAGDDWGGGGGGCDGGGSEGGGAGRAGGGARSAGGGGGGGRGRPRAWGAARCPRRRPAGPSGGDTTGQAAAQCGRTSTRRART